MLALFIVLAIAAAYVTVAALERTPPPEQLAARMERKRLAPRDRYGIDPVSLRSVPALPPLAARAT